MFLNRPLSRKFHTAILFIGIISTIIITITYPWTRYTSITTIKLWAQTSWISYSILYFYFSKFLFFNILQFRSSDESLQSFIRLQRHDNGIHRPPVSHRHSLIPQAPKIEWKRNRQIQMYHLRILPAVEYKSKKLEQKKKISIFKFI